MGATRATRRSHFAAAAALLGLLVAGPVLAGAGHDEALRQGAFAREELGRGAYDRALKSAESALTLDPGFAEALLLKALAYEGLGEFAPAWSLLQAHQAATGHWPPGSEPHQALIRVEAAMAAGASSSEDPLALLDPGPIQARVEEALVAGRCIDAVASAEELVRARPAEAMSWRLRGDAARCGNHGREALFAYRRYGELGGDDAGVLRLIDDLSDGLARVRVSLELAEGSSLPRLKLLTGAEELSPSSEADGSFLFADLPVRVDLTLAVAGRGLESSRREIPPLGPGQELALTVEPVFVGLGEVQVADYDPQVCTARLRTAGAEVEATPGALVTVTAGPVTCLVATPEGVTEVALEVQPDGREAIDPSDYLPAALTVVGLPAGSEVRVFVLGAEDRDFDRVERVPPHLGEIDGVTGVRVAPPLRIESLVGGRSGLWVRHPVLGKGNHEALLTAGTPNATTFEWRGAHEMQEGIAAVQGRYEAWQQARDALEARARTRTAGLGVVSGVLAAAGAGLLVAGAAQQGRLDALRDQADAMVRRGDDPSPVRVDFDEAGARRTGLLAAGGAGLGLAGAGVVLTFGSLAQGRRALEREPWEPWEVDR